MSLVREDGLPTPVTGEQQYLAAILDELRGLAHAASSPAVEPAVVELREPAAAVVDDSAALPTPDPALDGATVAAAEKAAEEAVKVRARTARKRTTKKRAPK